MSSTRTELTRGLTSCISARPSPFRFGKWKLVPLSLKAEPRQTSPASDHVNELPELGICPWL
jgi:hypothetical protein